MSKHTHLNGKNNNVRSKTGFWHPDNLRFHTHVLTSAACSGHPGSIVIGGKLVQQLVTPYESK